MNYRDMLLREYFNEDFEDEINNDYYDTDYSYNNQYLQEFPITVAEAFEFLILKEDSRKNAEKQDQFNSSLYDMINQLHDMKAQNQSAEKLSFNAQDRLRGELKKAGLSYDTFFDADGKWKTAGSLSIKIPDPTHPGSTKTITGTVDSLLNDAYKDARKLKQQNNGQKWASDQAKQANKQMYDQHIENAKGKHEVNYPIISSRLPFKNGKFYLRPHKNNHSLDTEITDLRYVHPSTGEVTIIKTQKDLSKVIKKYGKDFNADLGLKAITVGSTSPKRVISNSELKAGYAEYAKGKIAQKGKKTAEDFDGSNGNNGGGSGSPNVPVGYGMGAEDAEEGNEPNPEDSKRLSTKKKLAIGGAAATGAAGTAVAISGFKNLKDLKDPVKAKAAYERSGSNMPFEEWWRIQKKKAGLKAGIGSALAAASVVGGVAAAKSNKLNEAQAIMEQYEKIEIEEAYFEGYYGQLIAEECGYNSEYELCLSEGYVDNLYEFYYCF